MNKNNLYLQCSCHGHMMTIEKDLDPVVPMWYVAYWKRGHNFGALSWKARLRHIWHILTSGSPYNDELVLEKPQMIELKSYIDNQLASTQTDCK